MAKKLKKLMKSFTLIELIIVIAIIAVLGTAAFLVLSQWMSKSRDSRRISDLGAIEKSMTISFIKNESSRYPDPDGLVQVVVGNGGIVWKQGVFGDGVMEFADNMQKLPMDPNGTHYFYSVTADNKYYEYLALLENNRKIGILGSNVYAQDGDYSFVLTNFDGFALAITGTYPNQQVLLVQTPTILVKPDLLSGVVGNYLVDFQSDVVEKDGSISSNPQIITGDISTFFDGDDSNNGDAQDDILDLFPTLNTEKFTQIIKKGGSSSTIVSNGGGESSEGSCAAQDLYDDSEGMDFHFPSLSNGEIGTGATDAIGGAFMTQLGKCIDGVLSFEHDTKLMDCEDPNKTFDEWEGTCVAECGGLPLPANAFTLAPKVTYEDGWQFDKYKEWGECTFRCNSGYYYDLPENEEQPGTCTVSVCQGTVSDFAELYGTPDGTWSSGTREYYYDYNESTDELNPPADTKCKFRCADTYEWDSESGQCIFQAPS